MNSNKAIAREEVYQAVQRPLRESYQYEQGILRAVRAFALEVHLEVCSCGLGGWYCPAARLYLPQK